MWYFLRKFTSTQPPNPNPYKNPSEDKDDGFMNPSEFNAPENHENVYHLRVIRNPDKIPVFELPQVIIGQHSTKIEYDFIEGGGVDWTSTANYDDIKLWVQCEIRTHSRIF